MIIIMIIIIKFIIITIIKQNLLELSDLFMGEHCQKSHCDLLSKVKYCVACALFDCPQSYDSYLKLQKA